MSNFDVIVVGGGPAGSAAAIYCAQMGLQVVIIAAKLLGRHPGETLHPGIEPLLKQLGVSEQVLAAGFLRHYGNWVQWQGDLQFMPFGADEAGLWQGFQAWRADFDAILLSRAQALGVTVLQPCRANRLIVDEHRVVGVETHQGALRAPFVIDAAGSQHWLTRHLGLKINYYSPRLFVHYGYVEGECSIRDHAPAIIADQQGWLWTARVRPQLYQWTRLLLKNEQLNRDWVPQEFSGLRARGKPCKADVTWRVVSNPAGLGYFLVGDAAAVLDPASAHGVLKAVMSGMMAGYLIIQLLSQPQFEHVAVHKYCEWVHNWFQHDVQKLQQLYASLPTPPNW